MNWLIYIVMALLAVAIETSKARDLVALHGMGELHPSLAGILVVFVALFAPRSVALWAAWGAGLLLDLAEPQPRHVLIGPHALGFVFGAVIVLHVRTMVFRRRILTVAALTLVCLVAAGIIEVAIGTVRSWYAEAGSADAAFRPFFELMRRFGIAFYSALVAIPIGWFLIQSTPLWSFEQGSERRKGGKSWR